MADTQIAGPIPPTFGNMSKVAYIDLSYNRGLNGSIPSSFGNLKNLWHLDLSHTSISGSLPPSLGNMDSMAELFLDDTSISGRIPESFAELTSLRYLSMQNNKLNASIPEIFTNMTKLISLSLKDNQLTGQIPQSLGNATSLIDSNLSGNLLTGSIPDTLGNLTSLSFLELSRNGLSGQLPESLGQMSNLSYLYISSTNISGSLPISLAKLPKLQSMGLWDNYIDGVIPEAYGNITTLTSFFVQSNLLTGNIPLSFANLSELSLILKIGPQKVVCEKFPSHHSASPTNAIKLTTPSVSSSANFPLGLQQNPFSIIVATVTIVNDGPESNLQPSAPTSTNLPTGNYQTSSSSKVIAAAATSSVGALLVICAFAWFIRRREKQKVDEVIAKEAAKPSVEIDNRVAMDTVATTGLSSAVPELQTEEIELATVPWLAELHPTTQQSLFSKHANSNANYNAVVNTISPTSKTLTALQNNNVDQKFASEIEPSMQRFIYSEIINEGAPTSNINLENHLQRVHGSYTLWTHEFVIEWARLKRVDSAVVGILKTTLDVHSLKEKCNVQDFRLRAKFMQAVEYLKDSHRLIMNSTTIAATDGDGLPQYEIAAGGNA
ncbi:hypothetical protein HDU76_013599 [Blyttiomyces sp. JEL0837]|nr:hypothetical protein HDU76_013599 [Blyttiomyces sp. JEL0837]